MAQDNSLHAAVAFRSDPLPVSARSSQRDLLTRPSLLEDIRAHPGMEFPSEPDILPRATKAPEGRGYRIAGEGIKWPLIARR